ncbi:helix-turn-helix transcriptional regulator [Schlesneria sp. DSM 10557]|uniref:helix-turn-helix transcriptional regulator n=1 Tax=Schlesneria sp. DSM 10557 TaxID=3044399 RepID=UPI0035A00F1C
MLLRIEDVSERLHLTPRAVRTAWYEGRIPAPIRVGRRSIRWRLDELEKFIASQPGAVRPIKEKSDVKV